MFDETRGQVVDLRRAGQRLVASVQKLEETDLADDSSVARWLQELDRAAIASDEARRRASALRTAIAGTRSLPKISRGHIQPCLEDLPGAPIPRLRSPIPGSHVGFVVRAAIPAGLLPPLISHRWRRLAFVPLGPLVDMQLTLSIWPHCPTLMVRHTDFQP